MTFFPTPSLYVGIETKDKMRNVACLRKKRNGWEVLYLKTYAENEPVKPLDKEIFVSALPSRDVLVRGCEIHVKKERDVRAALAFQIEPQLPYSADNAIIQAQHIEKRASGTLITAFAARQDHVEGHIEQLRREGLEPERVTCVPYALAALTQLFPQTSSPQFLIYEGEEEVTCVLVERGKLLAQRAFERSQDIGKEVQKTVLSFSSTHKSKPFDLILLIGKENAEIQKATGKMVLAPSTSQLPLSQEELLRYGLAIGTALAGEGIDFRQKTFTYPHKWRRVTKPLLACLTFSLLLSGALFGFTQMSLKKQQEGIEKTYVSLLNTEKMPVGALPEAPLDYLSSLSGVEKEVQKRPDIYPLLPVVPKVKEFFGWLSTLPGIELESVHYTMVKRPDFSHKKERYKVKVDLEFTADDVKSATAFQKALATGMVDAHEEVQWTTGKGKYRASFYLQDKTRYR